MAAHAAGWAVNEHEVTQRGRLHRKRSQCAQILDVLEDGGWHTTAEILGIVPSVVHSRIAELRRKGYVIEHACDGPGADGNRYRLVPRDTLFPLDEAV